MGELNARRSEGYVPPPMAGELVSIPTAGQPLDGIWYHSEEPIGAAMLLHGNGGNFYTGPARFLPPHLRPLGLSCFAFNRRGHETLTTRTRAPEGNAYQTAAQTIEDNVTAAAHVAGRGFPNPVVVGHSNGGLYGTYHVAAHGARALVLLSAHCGGPEMLLRASALGLLACDEGDRLHREARALVDSGHPEALLLMPGWWYVTSAASYLDMETEVPRLLEAAERVSCPVLFLRGGTEDPELYPAEAFAEAAAGPVEVEIVRGADHFYSGHEQEVGALVAAWLKGVLQEGA